MWEPPTLWMLIRLLAEAADDDAGNDRAGDISLSWFAPAIDDVVRSRPDGCDHCRPAVLKALNDFRDFPRAETLSALSQWHGCDCPRRTDDVLSKGTGDQGDFRDRLRQIAQRWTERNLSAAPVPSPS